MWIIHFFSMFFLGLLAWWALDRRVPSRVFWGYVALMLVRLSLFWALEYAVALAAGVAIYVVGRSGHLDDWLGARWLQYLGRISYSLYLIHYPVSWLVGRLGYSLTGDSAWAALGWLVVSLLASIAAAHVLCALVETPSIRFARRFKLAN
jgi:peptidoglycan/LPS O-acetylase OafA/YrhL